MGDGRSSALPIVALVACLAAVAFVWIDRPGGSPADDTLSAGSRSPVESVEAPLVRGSTEITLPSPIGPLTSGDAAAPEPVDDLISGPTDRTAGGMAVSLSGPVASPTLVADAKGSRLAVFADPADAEPGEWLDNPTWEGLAVVLLVHERRGDWLRVQVAMRPNGAIAWVRAADVDLRPVDYQIVVDATHLRLVLYRDYRPIFEAPVAVGKGSTPTPNGNFFVDGIVALADTTTYYGSHQISVAAYSEVYRSFGGGIGQIALHGTNQPNLLGSPVSNGCVRLHNDDIARLASLVPTGTPVQIVA